MQTVPEALLAPCAPGCSRAVTYCVEESCYLQLMIDPANSFNDVCSPFTEVPAWWSGFLFHVLNTRQLSVYLYLCMLSDESGTCHPTSNQIRQDLGLSSLTIIFDAMSVLESYGFVLRQRGSVPGSNTRRNVYQRPTCEYTVLRLLQCERLDGLLRPVAGRRQRDVRATRVGCATSGCATRWACTTRSTRRPPTRPSAAC